MSEKATREDANARRDIEEVAAMVVDAALQLHRDLGPGLLINFGAPLLKDGLKRVVNRHTNFASSRLRVHKAQELTE